MKIAILGATSEIAKDLIISFSSHNEHELILFARRPEEVARWLSLVNISNKYPAYGFESFSQFSDLDAILNFVGSGDPAKTKLMGSSIMEITERYDLLALNYLKFHPECKYIFISSGAVYGIDFLEAASIDKKALIPINDVGIQDWYGLSKLLAECRHRAHSNQSIIDIRVFNYFSYTQNMNTDFFISEIIRAISKKVKLYTSFSSMIRDYVGRKDFFALILCLLDTKNFNGPVDCYSKEPIEKFDLIQLMVEKFGLIFEVTEKFSDTKIKNLKKNYFSINHLASNFGYEPQYSSADLIKEEALNFFIQKHTKF